MRTQQVKTIKWEDIKVGDVFGDAHNQNEYTVVRKEYCPVWRKYIVWTTDLYDYEEDGDMTGFSVEQINETIALDTWYNVAGFYNHK
jgi:hypothetical protein